MNLDPKEIAKELIGKTVENAQIGVKTVVIKFTDGTYLDVDLDKTDLLLRTSISKE